MYLFGGNQAKLIPNSVSSVNRGFRRHFAYHLHMNGGGRGLAPALTLALALARALTLARAPALTLVIAQAPACAPSG